MKTLMAAAAALIACSLGGCWRENREPQDGRYGYDGTRGGPRDDWNRQHTDPVCGRTVDPKTAWREAYNGQSYYFHSEDCARRFHEDPSAFFWPGDRRTVESNRPDRGSP